VWENNFRAKLDVEHTAYGFRYAGIRKLDETSSNARVTAVVYPNITLIPSKAESARHAAGQCIRAAR